MGINRCDQTDLNGLKNKTDWDKSNFVPVPFCVITTIIKRKREIKGNFLPYN
ncbi:hypothetical protein LDI01_21440 [Lentilactobacillus diolivorans]|uniref:Uncharacterized protein n=1 Tax=Lentilactobacillus diolivorans TaxID=179838 RepID=A0ABQ0XEP0_9LACO|nr:hypothetical protein LDI01_21440 [Lentilactobacillus diolivorans]